MAPLSASYAMLKSFQFENVPEDVDIEFLSNMGPMFVGGKKNNVSKCGGEKFVTNSV